MAAELQISRTIVQNFFAGKPVSRGYFHKICKKLKLDWREIADLPKDEKSELEEKKQGTHKIDALVQEVRQKRHEKIQYQCGTMRMLDISQPVALADIYTDVNILEQITSKSSPKISDLVQGFNPESDDFDRLDRVVQERVPGLLAVSRYCKLMVLGKPGAGKTTFLQWVAIKCDLGDFQSDRVPIFIRLKYFAEDTRRDDSEFKLLNYISQEFSDCGIADKSLIEMILTKGKALILLDGLDEVSEEDDEIVKHIRQFVNKYFKNQFIITCRIAAQKYIFSVENFTDVEVADFNHEQVAAFATKWFIAVARNDAEGGKATAKLFIKKLNLPENKPIRKLAVTPILLNLTCFVFQAKGEFPSKRSKLYEQGLDILLVTWDESRGIQRDDFYHNLSLEHKIELLSQVAAITFEKTRYFFEQDEVERYIADYLRTLPNTQNDRASLQQNSKALLKSIEAEHGLLVERARGIYSFSHLTFQEYFTAKWFVERTDWQGLMSHMSEKGWREVFLLSFEMMKPADSLLLLMKRKIDLMLASDNYLQNLFSEIYQKSKLLYELFDIPYRFESFLAYYHDFLLRYAYYNLKLASCLIDYDFEIDYNSAFKIMKNLVEIQVNYGFSSAALHISVKLDSQIGNYPMNLIDIFLSEHTDNSRSQNIDKLLAIHRIKALLRPINIVRNSSELEEYLKDHFKEINDRIYQLIEIWKSSHKLLVSSFKSLIFNNSNIGNDWQFSEQQQKILHQYYNANPLLLDCLNSGCEVSPAVRQEIEETLLLPIAEIEQRQQQIS
ncbi:NACHT domain-containing protein [Mastigocladopsis repens]|uniref:NACHT domain-containing protein n=1 Tax=Mastigocladopsis repens TaxID=221287 RepID=UPI001E50FAD3|nr:NACHT domain-containing NTPase [Mastigocladopsis repens]